jgi:hypothetical protein
MNLRNVKYNLAFTLNNPPFLIPEENSQEISLAPQIIPNVDQMNNEGILD